jgi:hypothetical protein
MFGMMKNDVLQIIRDNQRLPGACNRSPGSKLLSITTQLHCGGHLGGRAQLPVNFDPTFRVRIILNKTQKESFILVFIL